MPNDLQHAANLTAAEHRAVRSRIDGLTDRAHALDRILDAYRLAGIEPDDTLARSEYAQQVVDTIATSNESGRPVAPRLRAATIVAQLPAPKITGRTAVDYAEVARIAAAARAAGHPASAAIADRYGISTGAAKQRIRQARLNGHAIPGGDKTAGRRSAPPQPPLSSVPSGLGPIERHPFDPQKVRDEQAGPTVGRIEPIGSSIPTKTTTKTVRPTGDWTPERAAAAIESAAG